MAYKHGKAEHGNDQLDLYVGGISFCPVNTVSLIRAGNRENAKSYS